MQSLPWTSMGCIALSFALATPAAAQCGGTTVADCCVEHFGPGCSDQGCCETVCALDPFCCHSSWDSFCVASALANCAASACGGGGGGGLCGDPNPNDCCAANETPGCSDQNCCVLVCSVDPYCCELQWEQTCAIKAYDLCSTCEPDCSSGKNPTVVALGENAFLNTATYCNLDLAGSCADVWGESVIWSASYFSFTPKESGVYNFSTCSNEFNGYHSEMVVMNGTDPADGVLGCSESVFDWTNSACYGFGAWIPDIALEGGRTYIIAIGAQEAHNPPSGGGTLTIGRQDGACSAVVDATLGFNKFGMPAEETAYIDLRADEVAETSGMRRLFNARLFKFTPTETARYTVSTCGQAEFDSELAILRGCSVEDGVVVANASGACVTESGGFIVTTPLASIIGVELEAGVDYYIAVGGALAMARGAGSIEITRFEPCPLDAANILDDEACGASDLDDANCIPQPPERLTPGDTIQGTFWTSRPTAETGLNYRDYDLYTLVIPTTQEVALSLRSEIPAVVALQSACGLSEVVATTDPLAICAGNLLITLDAGEYYLFVFPSIRTDGFGCGGRLSNLYTLSVDGGGGANCPADINADGEVDAFDLAGLLGNWGGSGAGDINNDGEVTAQDLAALLSAWGPCLP